MKIPRLMIAGTHSGVGKTTITTALMAALRNQGYNVQPYKVGPDYIDPSYHTIATGNRSRNLDAWMLSETTVKDLFVQSAAKADIAVIEGVMGVFDGSSGIGEQGSSAHIAKLLKCPVVLIVDVKSMARSAAALVLGFRNFDPELEIAGVILNRVGSDRHLKLVTEAIETYSDVPVIGYIKKNARLELPSRHLGLVPTVEGGGLPDKVMTLADEIKEGIDTGRLVQIAQAARRLEAAGGQPVGSGGCGSPKVRIGLAWDEAFSFYYQDGLETLERLGAQLVRFSPLHDLRLPEGIDGLYIGGGFPEVFIRELGSNQELMEDIRKAGRAGMPIFAECGGLMYLCRAIVDFEGEEYPMVGLVPGKCLMEKKLVGMGYVESESLSDNILSASGGRIRGHEFHYSRIQPVPDEEFDYAFQLHRNRYRDSILDGYARGNVLASYLHLHFASDPGLAERYINACEKYKQEKVI